MGDSHVSEIEKTMLGILDVLIDEGGYFTAGWGQVLKTLASRIYGEDVRVRDNQYHRTSLAVLKLEAIGFVEVSRAGARQAEKANIIESLRLL